jgi:hypothetical protein
MMMWGLRYGNCEIVYSDDLTELGEYITKGSKDDGEEVPRERARQKNRKRWRASKNLAHPVPKKRIARANTWREEVRPPRGYALVRDSLLSGVNALGYPWMEYRLLKIPEPERKRRRRE